MSIPFARVKELEKSYGKTVALASVSLDVGKGEMFGLIGPDGAGKTTLMRILSSLLDPDSGDCVVAGVSVSEDPAGIRRIIGYMPQRFSLYQDLTVGENLRFFADLFRVPRRERIKRTAMLLEFARLEPFVKRQAGRLSGGMKQKLALACALVHTPEFLILDEPTTGVDPVSRREFWSILKKLKETGVTILVSTPYMEEAELCDRVALMHKGRVLMTGVAKDIAQGFAGTVYSVACDDTVGLAVWLKGRLTPEQVRIVGTRVHVSLFGDTGRAIAGLEREAATAGFSIAMAEPVPAALEDAFVAMIAERERRHDAA
ncbi:MAG: ABC transporter [Desulfococcus sp. 4484_241]|nr:MAG: ABC transporter [Desulfococcus sp. 4484_241]